MRAKFQVQKIAQTLSGQELTMCAVGSNAYGPNGESEDNTFAKYTPSGTLTIWINNSALEGVFIPGDNYYLDFTKVEKA